MATWVQADFRELPFEDESFDAVLCLFTSIGYRGEEGTQAFAEFLRVLRPGAPLVIETLHRDRLMAILQQRRWEPLEDDAVLLEERDFDYVAGEGVTKHTYLSVGERRSVTFRLRCYTATELVKLLAEVGFTGSVLRRLRGRAPHERRASLSERESPRRARSDLLRGELERAPQRLVQMALLDRRRPVDDLL